MRSLDEVFGVESAATETDLPDLICLSHLRWNFVFQRPQHLLSRFAAHQRVFFVEEPVADDGPARLVVRTSDVGVAVAVPHLPSAQLADPAVANAIQRQLLDSLIRSESIGDYVLWYYTPMALAFSSHLRPRLTVYDCMDELSAFANAPQEMRLRETELLGRADIVMTGGRSLYEAKRDRHPNVHCFPSSVDAAHFGRARRITGEPPDQAQIPRPRIGYAGVIDERMDLPLIAAVAAARPDWQLVMLGPVAKVAPSSLPKADNIHYVGMKAYADLPAYLAGWDVAMLPFAHNDSTRFISPTKTPEYLAAGVPVVSTSITDVVRPYGVEGLAQIADTPMEFVDAIAGALATDPAAVIAHRQRADRFIERSSWRDTAEQMVQLMAVALAARADEGGGRCSISSW